MTTQKPNRRTFIKASGGVLTLGVLAGCLGDDEEPEPTDDDTNGDDEPGEVDIDDYLSDAPNYDQVHDFTGQAEVTVENGMSDEHGQYAFEPAAIEIDAGTTVIWEWIDDDSHSVTSEDQIFDSGTDSGQGTTFEHTFDNPGTYAYYCQPHRAIGQKGVVVVV